MNFPCKKRVPFLLFLLFATPFLSFCKTSVFLFQQKFASDQKFIHLIPLADLHNDRSFFITGKGTGWEECQGMNLCRGNYKKARFFFSLWRPPLPIAPYRKPWELTPLQATSLNQISHFDYLLQAISDIEKQTRLPIRTHPSAFNPQEQDSIFLGVEGSYLLDRSHSKEKMAPSESELIGMLERLKKKVSYLSISWSHSNPYSGTSNESIGLSTKGRNLLRLLIRFGILIDWSHASEASVLDFYEFTKGRYPLFFSHSSVRKLCAHPRNLSEKILKLTEKTKGLIGINFHAPYINCGLPTQIDDVLRHIHHIRNHYSASILGLGSDFDAKAVIPKGLEEPIGIRNLGMKMLLSGFTRSEVQDIFYRNIQKLLKRVQELNETDVFGQKSY